MKPNTYEVIKKNADENRFRDLEEKVVLSRGNHMHIGVSGRKILYIFLA